jgi:hypothetical protein
MRMADLHVICTQSPNPVRAVRSSPQRKQSWLEHVTDSLRKKNPGADRLAAALMLILDVRTRWSLTHQMMSRSQFDSGII